MSLPIPPLPTGSVEIAGQRVEFRALSRAQALKMQTFRGREDEAEVHLIVCATGVTEAEATTWRESVDTETAGLLIDAIVVLSGLARERKDAEGNARG